ncbi:CPBP family intramembrane glutamic endopeptidase [Celeribacter sp.]|uniref:CPBP family intramembrane glutamic endopeptidase n=1 Tax=Celeribacter sp. TaxID=1890673 RepID=UPI003A8D561A
MIDPDYSAMLASARRHPEQWRIFAILAVGLFVMMLGTPLFFLVVGSAASELNVVALGRNHIPRLGVTPGGAFVVFSSFVVMIGATWLTAKRLNARGLRDITGPAARLRADFVTCGKWVVGITALTMLLPWDHAEMEFVAQYTSSQWLFWLPLALLGLMIQVTAEEMFFRGYLQTQITGATGSIALGILFSALVFGIGHLGARDGVGTAGMIFPVIWAVAFGLVAGDLTARSGSIGPAIALHLVHNATAMLIAPHEDLLSGFGLFVRTGGIASAYSDPLVMLFESLHLLVLWLTVRIALRR